jgi:hypothetical protein
MPNIGCIDWQAVGAVATLLAVVVALFIPFLPDWFVKPKLRLSFKLEIPYVRKSTTDDRGIAPPDYSYYARLLVENRGNRVANHVEVFVSTVEKKAPTTGRYELIPCDSGYLKWTNYGTRTVPQLPRDAQMLVDLGHALDPAYRLSLAGYQADGGDTLRTLFALDLHVTQRTNEHVLEPGEYRITLHCQAANAKPHRQVVEVTVAHDAHYGCAPTVFFEQYVKVRLCS